MAKSKTKTADVDTSSNEEFLAKLDRIEKAHGLIGNSNPSESGVTKKIIIKKAKLDSPFLNVSYHESIILISGTKRKDIGGTITREGENAPHDDLRNAFAKLNPHLALIAEMIQSDDDIHDFFMAPEMISEEAKEAVKLRWKDFKVTGFSIGGSGDTEGVTLIGQKVLSTSKILNLTTPFEKWAESQYTFISELAALIESCKYEVEEYLNGKMAPPAQQEMDFEGSEEAATEQTEEA